MSDRAREQALQVLGWHPFDLVDTHRSDGPFVNGLAALAVLSAAGFVWLLFSSRFRQSYFSLRFFLALIPLIAGSAIMFLRIYGGVYVVAHSVDYTHPFPVMFRLAFSAFQCGLLVSGIFVLTHTVVYAILSKRRDTSSVNEHLQEPIIVVAEQFFIKSFPGDRIVGSVIAEESSSGCVVGVSYDAECIPPPYRFFEVTLPDLSVSLMDAGYWPPRWGVYR